MKRLLVKDPQAALQGIEAMVGGAREQLVLHKLHCVLLVGRGCTCTQVAAWFGGTARSVERWVCAFNNDGLSGLRCRGSSGRPPRLAEDSARRLRCELRQAPAASGFGALRWTGRLLLQHLQEHYGICMSLRQCQRTLQHMESPRDRAAAA